jgi:hypothetical protein
MRVQKQRPYVFVSDLAMVKRMKAKQVSGHIDSFYRLARIGDGEQLCQGTASFVARHLNLGRWSSAVSGQERMYCLGNCFAAPASSTDVAHPEMRILSREPIVLGRIINGPIASIAASAARGVYRALEKALSRSPAELVSAVELSGLRGRGGAGFPTGKKWSAAAEQKGSEGDIYLQPPGSPRGRPN